MMPGMQNPAAFQMMPHMMPRPLFPSAAVTTSQQQQQQQKTTFPAYNNTATISAPPTVGNSNTTSTSSSDTQRSVATSVSSAPTSAMKIMHPPEDLSLEEIRARKQQYKTKIVNNNASSHYASQIAKSQEHNNRIQSEVSDFFRQLLLSFGGIFLLEPDRCVIRS